MYWKLCHTDLNEAIRRGDAAPAILRGHDCYASIRWLLRAGLQSWLRSHLLQPHLQVILALFSKRRLLVLHQATLREAPREIYNHVAHWLGLTKRFPETFRFRRRQFRLGHRSDLCHNASLQKALKRRLSSEYGAYLQAVALQNPRFPQQTAMTELQNHISRCDDQKELVEGDCGFYDKDDTGCPQQPDH